jgi:diguanylate cyclase (GGDEF)-like protein
MNLKSKKQQLFMSIITGVSVSCILTIFLFFLINTRVNRTRERERVEVLEKFLSFQSNIESLINENTNLLKGYLAYIETNPNISEDDTFKYLNRLLLNKTDIIRNVGIIKDTTIIWNYPKQGNEKAIGQDLTTIPSQKDYVLFVKNNKQPCLVGPIDLIQGGIGFITRLPIIINNTYWGQISIVLDANNYLNQLEELTQELELNVAIFNELEYPIKPFWGDKNIIKRDGMIVDIEILNNRWKVVIEPIYGWKKNIGYVNGAKIVAIVFSSIIGLFLFMIINTRYELKNQAMNDYLTGLYNRNYLGYYYHMIRKKAESSNSLIGVFLLDINKFKSINDSYGHKIGDLVLIEFAKRLQSIMGKDKKVFRLGGDEFLIVVPGQQDIKDIKYTERKVRAESSFRFKYEKIDIDVVSSIGFAAYPIDGKTLDEIIHIADSRMYKEKNKCKQDKTIVEY